MDKNDIVQLLTQAHPALQPIIAHHHPTSENECGGCDWGLGADYGPEWPCSTIELIVAGLRPIIEGELVE